VSCIQPRPLPSSPVLFTDAVRSRRGVLRARNPETLSHESSSGALRRARPYIPIQRVGARERQSRRCGRNTPTRYSITQLLPFVFEGSLHEARKLGQQALESKRRILGPNTQTTVSMSLLASISLMRPAARPEKPYTMTLWKVGTASSARSSWTHCR